MRYAISLVTYNSDTFLNDVLERCWALMEPAMAVIAVDNASKDSTLSILEAHQRHHPQLRILRNCINVGFAKAHNQAIALATRALSDAVLILNPDVLLEAESASYLLKRLRQSARIGSVTGKLLRLERGKNASILDSAGLRMFKSLRVVDRGSGEEDRGQYDLAEQILGGTGAATLYRIEALHDCAVGGEVFDETFMAYKEDVDVALRLKWRGWENWYEPEAIAHHYRSHRGGTLKEVFEQRKQRSVRTRRYSYRNHFWTMIKSIPLQVLLRFAPWIMVHEAGKIIFYLLFEPSTVVGAWQALRTAPVYIGKRRDIRSRSVISANEFVRWIG